MTTHRLGNTSIWVHIGPEKGTKKKMVENGTYYWEMDRVKYVFLISKYWIATSAKTGTQASTGKEYLCILF